MTYDNHNYGLDKTYIRIDVHAGKSTLTNFRSIDRDLILEQSKYIYIYIYLYTVYTVGTESIQTPLNFSLFVILQPFAKII